MENENAYLDWSKTARVRRLDSGRCVTCGEPSIIINPSGESQHKTCAEQQLDAEDAAAARYYGQAQGAL